MMRPSTVSSFVSVCRRALLGGIAVLTFSSLCSLAAADEQTPRQEPAAQASAGSAEGKQILGTGVLILGLLVGMERYCSWRLSANQRQAAANQQAFAEMLPLVPTNPPVGTTRTVFGGQNAGNLPPQNRLT